MFRLDRVWVYIGGNLLGYVIWVDAELVLMIAGFGLCLI